MNKFTYQAILRGDRLEWRGERPPETLRGELRVDVTVLQEPPAESGAGERMAAALERLAHSRAVAAIEDPVAWQREIRKDRPLPGRD
jgi:hypothetical protein